MKPKVIWEGKGIYDTVEVPIRVVFDPDREMPMLSVEFLYAHDAMGGEIWNRWGKYREEIPTEFLIHVGKMCYEMLEK